MPTSKPMEIVLDEVLYDTFPEKVDELVKQGHTVKKLQCRDYDIILGPKFGNLTVDDVKANPKLFDVALSRSKDEKYPKGEKPKKAPKEAKGGVEDPKEIAKLAEAGGVEEFTAVPKPPRKRKPRTKKEVGGGAGKAADQPGVDPAPVAGADPAGGGK